MKKTPFVLVQRGMVLGSWLLVFVFCVPVTAWALVAGSRHDFTTKTVDKGGVCTPCHSPHFSPYLPGGWPRSMTDEGNFYEQNGSSGANYIPGGTLLCYDCHDDNASADSDPANSVFTNPPQDIASGGVQAGYYEMACGQLPNPATPPTDGSPTGGHYWKTDPGGSPNFARGDKIPCSLCHDPHNKATGANEVFFRETTWNGFATVNLNDVNNYGTNLKASAGSRNGTGTGRAMCAICHGYSDQGNQAVLYNVTAPRPPGLGAGDVPVPEHARDDSAGATPCVACHGHNLVAGCNECHGYPPLNTTAFNRVSNPNGQSYGGGAGAHQRHLDSLGATIFNCAICHGPDPGRPTTSWHNQNAVNCGVPVAANVDVMGQTQYWGAGSSYNGITAGGFTGPDSLVYAFAAKGGGDQRCANLACHGYPPNTAGALNWGDDMVDEATGDAVSVEICKWCHDSTPARIGTGPVAPNVLGNNNGGASATGDWTTGAWGADVSGHGKPSGNYDATAVGGGGGAAAANKDCAICHDAAYGVAGPNKVHFDGANDSAEKRLRATINGLAAADADEACLRCHQNGAGGSAPEGTEVSVHGNDPVSGYSPLEAPFTRTCRQCHNVHGANWNGTGRNLHMIGTWVDADNDGVWDAGEEARVDADATDATTNITTADLRVVFTAFSGQDSFDDGFGDGQHESVCVVCHVVLTNNHNEVTSTDNIGDPDTHNLGTDCTQCHNHDYDETMTSADAWMPSGCSGCHGNATTDQFWPDGLDNNGTSRVVYADDGAGAHENHVAAISARVFGLTPAALLTDAATTEKQKQICRYCHQDPGGGNHNANGGADSRVDVYAATGPGDRFGKFGVGAEPLPPSVPTEDTTGAAYVPGSTSQGSCSNLVCHNQAATPFWNAPPVWALVISSCTNVNCHATATYTIAHATHVNGSPKSYACTECHADNYTASPTNPIPMAHGNGEVDMKWDNAGSLEVSHGGDGFYDKDSTAGTAPSAGDTAFAYKSGGALATDPAYARSCYRVYCHGGDNNATYTPDWGGSGNTPNTRSPVWNWDAAGTLTLACTTCHGAAPTTARHFAHDNNNAWVPNECGSCHAANNNKTSMAGYETSHANGTADMAAAVPYTAPNCTNACHLVGVAVPPVSADPGDWLDANDLACTDCHSPTYIGTTPSSGLHAATTAMAHDAQFMSTAGESPETATCTHCHLAAGPSAGHLAGSAGAAPPTQNSTETPYSFNTTYIPNAPPGSGYVNSGYPAATSCQATCHSDYKLADTGGLWRRQWVGVSDLKPLATDSPGAAVCGNCHGDLTGWNFDEANASTTDHTDPYSGNTGDKMDRHSVCETCHGWGYTGYDRAWNGVAPGHGDGSITMNGPDAAPGPAAGAQYDDATGGCAQACHGIALVLKTNSGWQVNYGNFGSGSCEGCHNGVQTQYPLAPNVMGDGTLPAGDPMHSSPQPFDDGAYGYNVNGHGRDGDTSTESHGDPIGVACTTCHDKNFPSGAHLDGTLDGHTPAVGNLNPFHLLSGFLTGSPPAEEWSAQVTFDSYCYSACHAAASATDMRHAIDTKSVHATPNVMEFGQYNSYSAPLNTPPPDIFYDVNIMWLGARNGAPNFGLCVSCHNPHGTDVSSPKNSGNNLMMLYRWETPAKLCAKCHK